MIYVLCQIYLKLVKNNNLSRFNEPNLTYFCHLRVVQRTTELNLRFAQDVWNTLFLYHNETTFCPILKQDYIRFHVV